MLSVGAYKFTIMLVSKYVIKSVFREARVRQFVRMHVILVTQTVVKRPYRISFGFQI